MNSYAIIRAIALINHMTYAEKFAGTMLALHLDRTTGKIKVRQRVIAEEAGLTVRVVQSAVKKMVETGIFKAQRKPRCLILTPQDSVKESVKMHMNERAYHRRTSVHITNTNIDHFAVDTTHSTAAEERQKRYERS